MNRALLLILFVVTTMYVIILNWNYSNACESFGETIEKFDALNGKQSTYSNMRKSNSKKVSLSNETSVENRVLENDENADKKSCDEKDTVQKCTLNQCGSGILHPILDPKFNFREVAKQCLLLEDHLNNIQKRCLDCIRKHFLIIDGLIEESVSLEKDNALRDQYRELYLKWVEMQKEYANAPTSSENLDNISKKIRLFRKPLVEKYFDMVKDYDSIGSTTSASSSESSSASSYE